MKERALLLGGGAFRGAVQIPVLEKLIQENHYDDIYGISVGAINGAMTAQGDFEALKDIWDNADSVSNFLHLKWYWPFYGLYSMDPLRKKLEENLDLKKINTNFTAGVVSGTTGEYFNLSTKNFKSNQEYCDAVQASACMAGVMVPGEFVYNDVKHIGFDGGYRNIIPWPEDTYKHIDVIFCVPLNKFKLIGGFNKRTILSLIFRGIEIFEEKIFNNDFAMLQKTEAESITAYFPQSDTGPSLSVSKKLIEYRYKLGEEAYKNPFKVK